MAKELICHANYRKGKCVFDVERETRGDRVEINLYRINKSARYARSSRAKGRVPVIQAEYRNIGTEYKSPYLSWYNWFFCSKWHIGMTDDRFLCTSVQKDQKTAAIVLHLPFRSRQWYRYRRRLENIPASCGFARYGTGGFYIYRKGSIDTLFDMEKIRYIYEAHGIDDLNWNRINSMSKLDLSCFGDSGTQPFNPYHPFTREQYAVNGLLLGYPVESTIVVINKTVRVFHAEPAD